MGKVSRGRTLSKVNGRSRAGRSEKMRAIKSDVSQGGRALLEVSRNGDWCSGGVLYRETWMA